ncbi:hypothetical protein OHV05_35270 (plasmid) [Kitasatospora sp. NBC_00070]|uniref:hypothetical protein n=1 Tax=Kitasatospora sp. NBC_00070 TaxID=2975962 RepID=UPI002F913D5C
MGTPAPHDHTGDKEEKKSAPRNTPHPSLAATVGWAVGKLSEASVRALATARPSGPTPPAPEHLPMSAHTARMLGPHHPTHAAPAVEEKKAKTSDEGEKEFKPFAQQEDIHYEQGVTPDHDGLTDRRFGKLWRLNTLTDEIEFKEKRVAILGARLLFNGKRFLLARGDKFFPVTISGSTGENGNFSLREFETVLQLSEAIKMVRTVPTWDVAAGHLLLNGKVLTYNELPIQVSISRIGRKAGVLFVEDGTSVKMIARKGTPAGLAGIDGYCAYSDFPSTADKEITYTGSRREALASALGGSFQPVLITPPDEILEALSNGVSFNI